MTVIEWLEHIHWSCRVPAKASADRVSAAYGVYRKAHQASSRVALVGLAFGNDDKMIRLAVFAGARDRDENKPLVVVEELLVPEKKHAEEAKEGCEDRPGDR